MRDTATHYDSTDIELNEGFEARRSLYFHVDPKKGDEGHTDLSGYVARPFTFTAVLFHDLCENNRGILWNVPLKFTFKKAAKEFYLQCRTADMDKDFDLVITRIQLKVRIANLTDKLIDSIERRLSEKKPARYYYRRFQVSQKPIP
jgi:hypothetical protein